MFFKAFNCCPSKDSYSYSDSDSEKSTTRFAQIECTTKESSSATLYTVNIRVAVFNLQKTTQYHIINIGKDTTVEQLEQTLRNDYDECNIGNPHLKIIAMPQGYTTKLSTKLSSFHLTQQNTEPLLHALKTSVKLSRKQYTKTIRAINKHHRRQDSLDWIKYRAHFKSNHQFNPAHKRNERYAQMMMNIPLPGRIFDKEDRVLNHIRVGEDEEGIVIHIAVIPCFDEHTSTLEEKHMHKVGGIHNKKVFTKIDRAIWKMVFWNPLV